MTVNYAFKTDRENVARAYGNSLGISTKQSVEITRMIRGMPVKKAKLMLEQVTRLERAVPMKRYNQDTAHKKGMAAGKYPVSAAKEILSIIKSAESNAKDKGLDTEYLIIYHISEHLASRPARYGRKKRSVMKRSHIQVVLLEKKPKAEKKAGEKPAEKKKEAKQEKKDKK